MVSAENVENFPSTGWTPNQKFAQNKVSIFVWYFRLTQDLKIYKAYDGEDEDDD